MTPFGMMKLSIIPEGIIVAVYNYHLHKTSKQGLKFPTYERFFESCIKYAQNENVELKSRWSRFYDACKQRAIDPQTTRTHLPPEVPIPKQHQDTEEDFWYVERDVVSRPDKWRTLGYIRNPWQKWMQANPHKHTHLFQLYLDAHLDTYPDPDKLAIYHQALNYALEQNILLPYNN